MGVIDEGYEFACLDRDQLYTTSLQLLLAYHVACIDEPLQEEQQRGPKALLS
jgi:hypothetical protein